MRIIAGNLRRRALKAPRGHLTRPTTDSTRESIFNLISSRLDFYDAQVLDLYAGTGALGYEALSRGANLALFVESHPRVMKVCKENAALLDVDEACVFYQVEVVSFLRTYKGAPFDLILADPPYDLEEISRLPALASPHVKPGGLFVLEHDKRHSFENHEQLVRTKSYGGTVVSIFGF